MDGYATCLADAGKVAKVIKTAGIFPILNANAYAVFAPDARRRAGDEVAFELMQPMPA
jgi:hypothetical protein